MEVLTVRKLIALILVAVMAISVIPVTANAQSGRGGLMGFIAGCPLACVLPQPITTAKKFIGANGSCSFPT
jgi:hypothetical protein